MFRFPLFSSLVLSGIALAQTAQCDEPTIIYKSHGEGNKVILSKAEKGDLEIKFVRKFDAGEKVVHTDATQDGKFVIACTQKGFVIWSVATGNKLLTKDGKNARVVFTPKPFTVFGEMDGKEAKWTFKEEDKKD